MNNFEKELRDLINTHSLENESNTPDFILATYMLDCLDAFNTATNKRDEFSFVADSGNLSSGQLLQLTKKRSEPE